MKCWTKFALVLAFLPFAAMAQYRDLDTAMANLQRGFGSGDSQAIVSGIAEGDKVKLQFPGLIEQGSSSFYGRGQAAELLDGLFSKVRPSGFEQQSARKVSRENQYHIKGSWKIENGGKTENRSLYITLQNKNDRWSVLAVVSAEKEE